MQKISLINFVVMQIIAVLAFIFIIFYLSKLFTANRFNRKFQDFVSNDNQEKDHSIENWIYNLYKNIIKFNSKILIKVPGIKKLATKYNKYLFIENELFTENIDYISLKVILAFIISLIAIVFLLFSFSFYDLIIAILFVILSSICVELFLYYYYKHYLKRLNIELLNSIHIINASLNVGLSITQSVYNASIKCDKLLRKELTTVYNDLNNGLAIDTAFKRLYERLQAPEILYLCTMLSVLSKVGGTTKETFKTLEDNYQNKINHQKSISNLIIPYKFIFYFIGIIPLIIFIYQIICNNNYLTNIITSWFSIIFFISAIILNIIYYILCINILEVSPNV